MIKLVITGLFFCMIAVAPVHADPNGFYNPYSDPEPGISGADATRMSGVIDMSAEVEHKTVHTDHGSKQSGLPQFDPTTFPSQIFWLFVMFVVLYLFFSRSALPKISATIEGRLTTIRSDLEQADKLSAKANDIKNEYEMAMDNAREEARGFLNTIINELRAQEQIDADKFRQHSEEEIQSLQRQAEKAKMAIKDDLLELSQALTKDIIEKLTPIHLNDGEIEQLTTPYFKGATIKKAR